MKRMRVERRGVLALGSAEKMNHEDTKARRKSGRRKSL
jgi:hypothetical protein